MLVGLTGGIGAGKTTVAALLSGYGATVIDADVLAREAIAPGSAGERAVIDALGDRVRGRGGAVDRAKLAAVVFADTEARDRLNAIVHPIVAARSRELQAAAPPGAIVVHDVPLLVEAGLVGDYDLVVVVEAPEPLRLQRLEKRGVAPDDARARIAAQASDAVRRAVADVVIDAGGSRAATAAQVAALWARLTRSAADQP